MAGGNDDSTYSNFKAQHANMFTINSSKFVRSGKHGSLSPKVNRDMVVVARDSP